MRQGSHNGRIRYAARTLLGCCIGAGLLAGAQARADTTDDLIEQLKAKGILSGGEYHKLKQRRAAEAKDVRVKREAKGLAPAPAGGPADPHFVTALDKGFGVRIGDVDVKLSGGIDFFAVEQFKGQVTGSATTGGVVGGLVNIDTSTVNNSNSTRGGMLGSSLVLSLATNQMGYDLGATFGFYSVGTNVNTGASPFNANSFGVAYGLGTASIDLRQVFGTIGTPEAGTVKIGRDLAFFGGDIILYDAMLLGVGLPFRNASPGFTSGHIGSGYVYADWLPQISYTSPSFYGFDASVGLFTPLSQAAVFTGTDSGNLSGHDQPMLQGRVRYKGDVAPSVKLTAWVSGLTEQQRSEGLAAGDALPAGQRIRASAVDGGAKLDVGDASFVGYGYYGNGLGTSVLFFDGISPNGQTRESYGWLGQASYTFFDKLTLGANYGISYLQSNSYDNVQNYNAFMLRSYESYVAFARYQLTSWVMLEANFFRGIAKNQSGGAFSSNALAVGTLFSF
ncbi:porin [Methylocella silvestris]|uniref:porin n=1 Tax=Methylocella silvestris TaxID=199596 RepID=UPI001FDEBA63|nr:porin [Methylocella silvestris]